MNFPLTLDHFFRRDQVAGGELKSVTLKRTIFHDDEVSGGGDHGFLFRTLFIL